MNTEPRHRLKSCNSIDTNHIPKNIKPMNNISKIPAIVVAKELSDIVVYTQAIKYRGLTCSSTSISLKTARKPPKKSMQQLVAQPSTTSTSINR